MARPSPLAVGDRSRIEFFLSFFFKLNSIQAITEQVTTVLDSLTNYNIRDILEREKKRQTCRTELSFKGFNIVLTCHITVK